MAFMIPLAIGATLIGGGIKAFGDIQAGQAAGAADTAGATAASEQAAQLAQAANVTRYAAGRGAQDIGLQARAGIGRMATTFAAGNIAGRTPTDVRGSQVALGVQRERETYARGMDVAQQEDIRAAQERFKAGELSTAAGQARTASTFAMAGDITSAIGGAASVAAKWYQTAPSSSSDPYT